MINYNKMMHQNSYTVEKVIAHNSTKILKYHINIIKFIQIKIVDYILSYKDGKK